MGVKLPVCEGTAASVVAVAAPGADVEPGAVVAAGAEVDPPVASSSPQAASRAAPVKPVAANAKAFLRSIVLCVRTLVQ